VAETALVPLLDSEAARRMHECGIGRRIAVRLGGSGDRRSFRPRGDESGGEGLSDGRVGYEGPTAPRPQAARGLGGVLAHGPVKVLVHSRSAFSHDPAIYRSVGLDVERAKIVVVKSPTQFRACYEPIASEIAEVATPGVTTVDLRSLPYRRIPRPMHPFDPEE